VTPSPPSSRRASEGGHGTSATAATARRRAFATECGRFARSRLDQPSPTRRPRAALPLARARRRRHRQATARERRVRYARKPAESYTRTTVPSASARYDFLKVRARCRGGHRRCAHPRHARCPHRDRRTTRPERWEQNAALLQAGPLPRDEVERSARAGARSPIRRGRVRFERRRRQRRSIQEKSVGTRRRWTGSTAKPSCSSTVRPNRVASPA